MSRTRIYDPLQPERRHEGVSSETRTELAKQLRELGVELVTVGLGSAWTSQRPRAPEVVCVIPGTDATTVLRK